MLQRLGVARGWVPHTTRSSPPLAPGDLTLRLILLRASQPPTPTPTHPSADDALSQFGLFSRATEVQLRKAATAAIKITGSSSGKGAQLFAKGFNFEALGIGGLNAEFQDIFRRAFASRTIPPDLLRKMGQRHVRGMLLYGPPGCGKTLIARQIGKALHAHPPKIVNGPEILNK